MYSFAIKWPLPFCQEWKTSSKRYETSHEAAIALAEFLEVAYINDCTLVGKIVKIEELAP